MNEEEKGTDLRASGKDKQVERRKCEEVDILVTQTHHWTTQSMKKMGQQTCWTCDMCWSCDMMICVNISHF